DKVNQAFGIVFGRLENYGARPVAEDHAGGTVGVIDDRGHHIRSDHQDSLVCASGDELRSCLHGVDESGAGSGEIESPDARGAEFVLDKAGSRGEQHVGRDCADDDRVHIAGSQATLGKSFFGGLDCEVAGGHAFFHDVAFANADAGENPVVGGVDHFFKVGVGQKFRRYIGAKGADFDSDAGGSGQ